MRRQGHRHGRFNLSPGGKRFTPQGLIQLRLGYSHAVAQVIGVAQVGVAQIGVEQVGVAQVGPGSDAVPSCVMWPLTPARVTDPCMAAPHILPSADTSASAPATS
jgi:hypothetical protein